MTRPCWLHGGTLTDPTCMPCQKMLQELRWVEVHERVDVTQDEIEVISKGGWL